MQDVIDNAKELSERFTGTTISDVLELQLKSLGAMVEAYRLDLVSDQLLAIRETCKLIRGE